MRAPSATTETLYPSCSRATTVAACWAVDMSISPSVAFCAVDSLPRIEALG